MTASRRLIALSTMAAAALLGGCGDDDELTTATTDDTASTTSPDTTATSESTTTSDDGVALGQSCQTDRYELSYPDAWHTAPSEDFRCKAFHPEPFEVEEQTEYRTAIFLSIEQVSFDRVVASMNEEREAEVLESEELEVDGRTAMRFDLRSNGEGLHPEGTRYTTYAVDLGGETLLANTVESHASTAYEELQRVLAGMMETLTVS